MHDPGCKFAAEREKCYCLASNDGSTREQRGGAARPPLRPFR